VAFVLGKCGQVNQGDAAEVPSVVMATRSVLEDSEDVKAVPSSILDRRGAHVN
jgi:hypothetical protein